MSDVTQILSQIQQGDRCASEQLPLLVYDALKQLDSVRGFDNSSYAPLLDTSDVRSFGLMIYDKKDGEFQLEVDWIKAVPKSMSGGDLES